jgi:hypothetical protein
VSYGRTESTEIILRITWKKTKTGGPIENTVNFALTTDNGKHTDTIEKFPFFNLNQQNRQLNESHAIIKNSVFDTHL